MKYYVERYYPLALAIAISALFYRYILHFEKIDSVIAKFMDSTLAISGALLGFLLTILTIINSIETRRMRFIKESGNFPLLNHYLRIGILTNIISISISFLLPILFSIKELTQDKWLIYTGIVFIVSFTWLTNIRFAIIFVKLLTDHSDNG